MLRSTPEESKPALIRKKAEPAYGARRKTAFSICCRLKARTPAVRLGCFFRRTWVRPDLCFETQSSLDKSILFRNPLCERAVLLRPVSPPQATGRFFLYAIQREKHTRSQRVGGSSSYLRRARERYKWAPHYWKKA
ncbi:unnamed protein product [Dovyalis caffra]|uniref:Uncharacterized protein n=1 Tax=Dovyalis caffra TaxID=77055 RepID=A0AAV1R6I5_9ROSI|nr:unnamed protein product [Dovyalis caffra]